VSELTFAQPVATPASETPEKQPKTWKRSKAIIALVATGCVCLGLGGMSSNGKADEAEKRADEAEAALAMAEGDATAAEAQTEARDEAEAIVAEGQAANDARSAELDTRNADLDAREAAVAQRETDIAARETAVGAAEAARDANSFGDGVYAVGTDIQPGTYHTDGSRDLCYYATLGADGSDILDNNIVDGGPATVVINSPFFESNGCGTWTRTG
jgi:hypothetical protein